MWDLLAAELIRHKVQVKTNLPAVSTPSSTMLYWGGGVITVLNAVTFCVYDTGITDGMT